LEVFVARLFSDPFLSRIDKAFAACSGRSVDRKGRRLHVGLVEVAHWQLLWVSVSLRRGK